MEVGRSRDTVYKYKHHHSPLIDTKVHISFFKRAAINCGDYNRSKQLLTRMFSLYHHHALTALFFLLPRSLAATCAKANHTPCIAGGTIPSASSNASRALSSASTPRTPSTYPSTSIPSTTILPSIAPALSVPTYSASQAYSPPAPSSAYPSPLAQPSTAPSSYGGSSSSSSSTANCPCCDPSFSAAEVATCWELVALGGAAAVDLTGGDGGGGGTSDVLGSSSSFGMLVKRQSELRHINDNARREEQQFCCPIEDQCRFDDAGAPFCLVSPPPLPPWKLMRLSGPWG